MDKVLGIINFEHDSCHIQGLSDHHNLASLSILGRYRLIDFVLSNITNSGVDKVQIYTKKDAKSLFEHIGNGEQYNINSKTGKLNIIPYVSTQASIYNNDMAAFRKNIKYIIDGSSNYIIVAPTHFVYQQDFQEVLKKHIEDQNEITVLYSKQDNCKQNYYNANILKFDKEKKLKGITKNLGSKEVCDISLDTYIFNTDVFIKLINKSKGISELFTLSDIIDFSIDTYKVGVYKHKGILFLVNSLESYLKTNIALKDTSYINKLNGLGWNLFTATKDSSPTLYSKSCNISNSLIANGCFIEGTVINSVISRNVIIKKGAIIKDSVILSGSYISELSYLDKCIVDKEASINHVKKLEGTEKDPCYIKREGII